MADPVMTADPSERPGHARLKRQQQEQQRRENQQQQQAGKKKFQGVYRSRWKWLADALAWCVRGPVLAAGFALAIEPLYRSALAWWQPWSSLSFYVAGTTAVHMLVYWLANGFFFCADHFGWLSNHKMPRSVRMLPTPNLYKRTLIEALADQLSFQPVGLYLLLQFVVGVPDPAAPLASGPILALLFLGALLWNELFFYALHRAFHEVPFLYANIHKKHHQYVGTVGFAAEHAHPVEHLLSSFFPTAGFCILFGVHPLVWLVWLAWRLEETYETHSGYCFRRTWLGKLGLLSGEQTEFHDFHHSVNRGNYGHYLIDEIFGTMDQWLAMIQNARVPRLRKKKGVPAMANSDAPTYLQDAQKIAASHDGYTCCEDN